MGCFGVWVFPFVMGYWVIGFLFLSLYVKGLLRKLDGFFFRVLAFYLFLNL